MTSRVRGWLGRPPPSPPSPVLRPSAVLMVCTGNICRSPMAEVLLQARMQASGRDVTVASAGIRAPVGLPADPNVIDLMQDRGLDLLNHYAAQVSARLLADYPVIFVMEEAQADWINRRFRKVRGRVWHLGAASGGDITDPIGRSMETFEQVLVDIERGLDHWCQALWPVPGAGAQAKAPPE